MAEHKHVRTSKFLSLILRHRPRLVGLELDPEGWASVADVLDGARRKGHDISRETLGEVVADCPKQRFALSPDGLRIRANQEHSVRVRLGLEPVEPPAILFHGTVAMNLDSIFRHGLQRRKRHHVHLSPDVETATVVGDRRGEAILLEVAAGAMHRAGHVFFCSENGVWLTDEVPPEFLSRHGGGV